MRCQQYCYTLEGLVQTRFPAKEMIKNVAVLERVASQGKVGVGSYNDPSAVGCHPASRNGSLSFFKRSFLPLLATGSTVNSPKDACTWLNALRLNSALCVHYVRMQSPSHELDSSLLPGTSGLIPQSQRNLCSELSSLQKLLGLVGVRRIIVTLEWWEEWAEVVYNSCLENGCQTSLRNVV